MSAINEVENLTKELEEQTVALDIFTKNVIKKTKELLKLSKEIEDQTKELNSKHYRHVRAYIQDFLIVEIARHPNFFTLSESDARAVIDDFNNIRDYITRLNEEDVYHQDKYGNCLRTSWEVAPDDIETAEKIRNVIRAGSFRRGATEEDHKRVERKVAYFDRCLRMLQRLKGIETENMEELIPDAFKVEAKIDLDAIGLPRTI